MSAQERRRLKRIRNDVIERDGLVCCYCDKVLVLKEVTMEHIVPDSKRGTYNTTNLTVACSPCNNKRGSQPFFEFATQFNFSQEKMDKYKKLYYNNLKIKVLNVAKEECLIEPEAIPQEVINEACKVLKIKPILFDEWESLIEIKFNELEKRRKIKYHFHNLIKIIESSV